MNYKTKNFLFGWDYIHWRNTWDQGIARVYLDGDGTPYYWRYENTQVCDRIEHPSQVIWLTCPSTKYFKQKT